MLVERGGHPHATVRYEPHMTAAGRSSTRSRLPYVALATRLPLEGGISRRRITEVAQDEPTVREPYVGPSLPEPDDAHGRLSQAPLLAVTDKPASSVPLPTRTTLGDDLLEVVDRHHQSSARSSLLIVTAGSLAGSSFFLHQARHRYKRSLYVDLAITDVAELDRVRSNVLLLDHLHHGGYPDAQRGPYAFLAIKLPQLVARSRLTVITINLDWAKQFRDAFGISPVALAGASCAFAVVEDRKSVV